MTGFISDPLISYSGYDSSDFLPPSHRDEDHNTVQVNLPGPLSPEDKKLVEDFQLEVAATKLRTESLNDSSRIRLADGRVIYGSELKAIWSKLDFVINPAGYNGYANQSGRGEAAWRDGDPQVSFNVNLIKEYMRNEPAFLHGGMWAIFHELGHFVEPGRKLSADLHQGGLSPQEHATNEQFANDIAKTMSEVFLGSGNYLSMNHLTSVSPGNPHPFQPYSMTPPTWETPGYTPPPIPAWKLNTDDNGELYF